MEQLQKEADQDCFHALVLCYCGEKSENNQWRMKKKSSKQKENKKKGKKLSDLQHISLECQRNADQQIG